MGGCSNPLLALSGGSEGGKGTYMTGPSAHSASNNSFGMTWYTSALPVLLIVLFASSTIMGASLWGGGRRIAPFPLYPSSGKRHQLPYHPVARFKGGDTRSYYQPLDLPVVQDYFTSYSPGTSRWWMTRGEITTTEETPAEPETMSAGEILQLLAHAAALKVDSNGRMRSTMRFGISR